MSDSTVSIVQPAVQHRDLSYESLEMAETIRLLAWAGSWIYVDKSFRPSRHTYHRWCFHSRFNLYRWPCTDLPASWFWTPWIEMSSLTATAHLYYLSSLFTGPKYIAAAWSTTDWSDLQHTSYRLHPFIRQKPSQKYFHNSGQKLRNSRLGSLPTFTSIRNIRAGQNIIPEMYEHVTFKPEIYEQSTPHNLVNARRRGKFMSKTNGRPQIV